jgi:hypothetical protein
VTAQEFDRLAAALRQMDEAIADYLEVEEDSTGDDIFPALEPIGPEHNMQRAEAALKEAYLPIMGRPMLPNPGWSLWLRVKKHTNPGNTESDREAIQQAVQSYWEWVQQQLIEAEKLRTQCGLLTRNSRPPEADQGEGVGGSSKPTAKRGRKPDPGIDPRRDERIADAWDSGQYENYADLARELAIDRREVGKAIDRHRKREARKRQ